METPVVDIPAEKVLAFGRKWGLQEVSIFGSAAHGPFQADSDVDILISFLPDHAMTFEAFLAMRDELEDMFGGRKIDLVEKHLLKNPFRRRSILASRRIIYAA